MPDAIQILKPGWRALDANGDVIPGAVLSFFDAGTTTPREVFADFGLSASLGVEVTCDAGGYPASDSNMKTEIYTGSTPYRVVCETQGGVTQWAHDNIIGALDTSGFVTLGGIVPTTPIANTSSNQSIGQDDQGHFYNVNCSGGDVTITLDRASTLGNGFQITVRHDGTANQVLLEATGGDLMKVGSHAGVPAFALSAMGQTVAVTSDGAGFKVEETSPALFGTTGVILIAGRVSSAPDTPAEGARYIATSAGTWGAISVAQHDIVEAAPQGGWFRIVPPTNCGWIAYVQDESTYYCFKASVWDPEQASDSFRGKIEIAVQAEMEAATDAERAVTPARQHFHPGNAKAWVNFNGTGTVAIRSDYGVASISDLGTGQYRVNFDTAFSNADYAVAGIPFRTSSNASIRINADLSAGSSDIATGQPAQDSNNDQGIVCVQFMGDH